MTAPQDPFAAPDPNQPASTPPPPPPYGQPAGYGTPPPYGQAPGQGTPPPYGQAPGQGTAFGYGDPSATPYGQAPSTTWQGPPLAPWGTRVGGYLIDFLISLVVQLVIGQLSYGLGQVAGFAVFLYFGYLTGTTGQTPGRRAVGIKVLREVDGQPLGAGAGIGRAFLHILDALPLGLGFLWPIWDAKKQTFADKLIKSVVIKS